MKIRNGEKNIMNKKELITSIAEKSLLTKKDSELFLKAFVDSVVEALENGEKVQITGFGTFETVERSARDYRNPKTGEVVKKKATVAPKLKFAKDVKERVAK